jgi:hypothetical protein
MNTIRSNPSLLLQYNKIEKQVKEYRRLYGISSANQRLVDPNGVITIPVVVHIIHRNGEAIGTGANLSDAQIQSQITVLNQDFSRTNSDANQTPAAFVGVAANPLIRFELACTDPDGFTTNGITRTASGTANFNANRNGVKFTNQGGINAWATERYLNIWVAPNIGIGNLGSTQAPAAFASNPNTDGIVIVSNAFGTGAGFNLLPQYNLGRTTTHEVGHWLSLIHVWGPNNGGLGPNCNDSDECNDTPNQAEENFGAPTAHSSCSNGGDMFMNYMDYTDDVIMNLFSNDQRIRMRAIFMTGNVRSGFIDNYFKMVGSPNCTNNVLYGLRTAFCAANGNINWSVTGPATISTPFPGFTYSIISLNIPAGANGQGVLTASWNNFTDELPYVVGYGVESSTYNPNYYNSGNRSMTVNSTNMTSYNNWTYGQVAFTGATGTAKNWRLVSCNSCNPQTYFYGSGNNFGVYLTQPYAFATIRAEIPTSCGDKTVEYSFLGGYLNPRYGISPNPASNSITISATGLAADPNARVASPTAYEVQIFNNYSQLLKKTTCPSGANDVQIDISSFPSNQFYTVKLISANDVQTKSFFKQ